MLNYKQTMRDTLGNETPIVKIKGVGSSLWITIAQDASVETIRTELSRMLKPLNPTTEARVILDIGNASENEPHLTANSDSNKDSTQDSIERYRIISNFLKETFQLNHVTPPETEASTPEKSRPMRSYRNIISQHRSDSLVLAGRIRSGQTVQAKKHLIIMGDVNPGCEIVAGGDIIVFGSLSGMAAAGQPNNSEAIILALDFKPIQVKIGDVVAAGLPPAGHGVPEFAHVEDGAIIVENYLSANPFNRLPWPAIR